MKQFCGLVIETGHEVVAPHAGAWIETAAAAVNGDIDGVAPHAGAWIETQRNI